MNLAPEALLHVRMGRQPAGFRPNIDPFGPAYYIDLPCRSRIPEGVFCRMIPNRFLDSEARHCNH